MNKETIESSLLVAYYVANFVKSMNDLTIWGLFVSCVILFCICPIAWILTHPTNTTVIKHIYEEKQRKRKPRGTKRPIKRRGRKKSASKIT